MAAFCEANLLWTPDENVLKSKVEAAVRLGFDILVINNSVGEDALKGRKGKSKNEVGIAKASTVKLPEEYLEQLRQKYGRPIKQYTRFTTVVSDAGQTHKLQSDKTIQDYDIIAVQPTSEKTYQLACQTLDIDIISLDLTQRLPFFFKRTHVGVAIERGVHFEMLYSPAIRNQAHRRHTISNGLNLVKVCKGKNVLLSSGCEKDIELRGPYDVANLGLLFGLTEAQAKDALSVNARALFMHAKSRHVTGTVISVTSVDDVTSQDAWKVRETTSDVDEDNDDLTDDESDDEDDEDESIEDAKHQAETDDVTAMGQEETNGDGPPSPKKRKT